MFVTIGSQHINLERRGEFRTEITERGPNIEPVIHATHHWERGKTLSVLMHHSVVATYLRGAGERTYIVKLLRFRGVEMKGEERVSTATRERAAETMSKIEAIRGQEGYAFAAGIYEEGDE